MEMFIQCLHVNIYHPYTRILWSNVIKKVLKIIKYYPCGIKRKSTIMITYRRWKGGKLMTKMPVNFQSPEDIIKFVNIVSGYDYDVDLKCGHYVVDAKSLVSAFTLSNSTNIEMQIHGDDCNELLVHVAEYLCN